METDKAVRSQWLAANRHVALCTCATNQILIQKTQRPLFHCLIHLFYLTCLGFCSSCHFIPPWMPIRNMHPECCPCRYCAQPSVIVLVELNKNDETYGDTNNGHLFNVGNWMNLNRKNLICMSKYGDQFWKTTDWTVLSVSWIAGLCRVTR